MERSRAPRRLDIASLVRVRVEEHQVMRRGLQKAKESANAVDFEGIQRILGGWIRWSGNT